MLLKRKPIPEHPPQGGGGRCAVLIGLALLYFAGAVVASWNVVHSASASARDIEKALEKYSLKNEGAQALQKFKEQHPVISFFAGPTLQHQMKLPTEAQAADALYDDVPHLLKGVRKTSEVAAWYSWFLLSLSFFYVTAVIAFDRKFTSRAVLFALTSVSLFFFWIGIIAPAMIIWTSPVIPMATGDFSFVVQHQVRGIAAIIWELLTGGHWIIGGFLLAFSILTPLTKLSMTYFVTCSENKERNHWIAELLHTIGKWSMADVFVAAILLALYALKFQEATKSIPCLGLYYFIGYCLLSLTTTELLVHSAAVGAGNEKQSRRKLGLTMISALFVMFFCFISVSGLYTYQQYTKNLDEKIPTKISPQKLDNADLVLPVHKK